MYKSFDLLKKIYFVRTGGSVEENKAADILLEECKSLGVDAVKESFNVDGYDVKKVYLTFLDPEFEVECAGVGMTSSTPEEGLTGEFVYVDSLESAKFLDLENKVCLIHSKLVNNKIYNRL